MVALDALSIREVARCHGEISAMFERGETDLDLRALGSIDTAGLQLLLAAARAAAARGLQLRLHGAPALLGAAAAAVGMDAELGLSTGPVRTGPPP